MSSVLRELRFGLRRLLADKGFSAAVLLTLAVCVGANTAIFAIVNRVLLQPLPVPEAGRLVLMANHYPKAGVQLADYSSAGDYYDRLREVTALAEQGMFRFGSRNVEIRQRAERLRSMAATPSTFRLLRAAPALGRAFTDAEGEIGANDKVILSDGLWRQLFGGDPAAVGRTLRIDSRPFTVVGVMPAGFTFLDPEVRLWTPLAFTAEEKERHHSNNWHSIGRLRDGATVAQVQAQVNALNAANFERMPQFKQILIDAGFHTRVEPLAEMVVRDVRGALYMLWGAALLVLLIGALNIANLALARLAARRRETATRMALGAGPARLVSASVAECLLLAVGGGVAGIALGAGLLRMLPVIGLDRLPRAAEVQIDPRAVAVAVLLSVVVGLAMGLAPSAQVLRTRLAEVLHEDGRTGAGSRRSRLLRQSLVVAQFGFAFVLLSGAGLLLASFRALLAVDPGFRGDGVVTAQTVAPGARYGDDAALRGLMRRSLESIRGIPGVTAAGAVNTLPYSGDYSDSVILAEGYQMRPGESLISPRQVIVTPGYFETMGIKLVSGRYFDARDDEKGPRAVIVDERLARRFWANQDPVGRRMYQPSDEKDLLKVGPKTQWLRVVGVVRYVRLEDLTGTKSPVGAYYFPHAQQPSRRMGFAVRAHGAPEALVRALRDEMVRVDPELAMFDIRTMEERTRLSLATRRTALLIALSFAGLALFLSALGIYGVLAYLVTQRRREIGIRMALGSTAPGVARLVMREGFMLAALGLGLGLAGAVALRRAIESEIYGVQPLDPAVLGAVASLLAAVALVACVLPARRAAAVDPVRVLSQQ